MIEASLNWYDIFQGTIACAAIVTAIWTLRMRIKEVRKCELGADERCGKEAIEEYRNRSIHVLEYIEKKFNAAFINLGMPNIKYSRRDRNIDFVKDPEKCLKVIDEIYDNINSDLCHTRIRVCEQDFLSVNCGLTHVRNKLRDEYHHARFGLE
jgi:hypothetical protein